MDLKTYCKKSVENNAAAPDVRGAAVVGGTAENFRSGVVGRAAGGLAGCGFLHPSSKAEISYLGIVALGE